MKKKKYIALFTIVILLFCSSSILAEDDALENLQNQKNEITTQIDNTNEELLQIQNEMTDTLVQVAGLEEKMRGYEDEITELKQKLEEVKQSSTVTEQELATLEAEYNKQKKALDERIIAIYEGGETQYLDVLLNSRSLSDFISYYYAISQLIQYDVSLIESLETQKHEMKVKKEALENQKEQIKTLKQKQEKIATVLENTKVVYNNYYNQLTEQEKQTQVKLQQFEEQQRLVEEEIQRLLLQNLSAEYIGGEMAWPTPGYTRITSPYGMRTHPITGVYKLHTGVDLGAPYGSNFIAATDGTVITAGYNAAYGNMVIIDHGGGVSTLYAHGSKIMVEVGQTVKKGDIVLKVGSTGYSTGPHAHFEVRVNGKVVDPMPYITNTNGDNSKENTNTTNEQVINVQVQ